MNCYRIQGGRRLYGNVKIQGSKNAVLPMIAASLLCRGTVILHNCPKILDVYSMLSILKNLGCNVRWEQNTVIIAADGLFSCRVPEKYAGAMRSSVMLFGPLLGRIGCADIAYPGGCLIGARPIDIHEKALEQMGTIFENGEKSIFAEAVTLHGAVITLPFPSVGATENIVMAAVLADGVTSIKNAAKEPEITALCSFLRSMGAKISGDGTDIIYIKGVSSLTGTEWTVPCDRIVMGTYAAAVLGTGGEIFLEGDCARELSAFLTMAEQGAILRCTGHGLQVSVKKPFSSQVHIVTEPYPGFPTDLQSQALAMLASSSQISSIKETIFESRFHICRELEKMGADLRVKGRTVWIYGKKHLFGKAVHAADLRGGAALIVAGLCAQGKTQVYGTRHIRRGYQQIDQDLRALGADIDIEQV